MTYRIITKKRLITAASIIALAAVAAHFLLPHEEDQSAPKFTTTLAARQRILQSVTATGTVEPVTQVDIGTQVSGILTTLYVDYNSTVKQGQVIAELDKSTLLLDLNSNKSNMAATKSRYDYQKANYTRVEALYKQELIADSEYEKALYDYESAKNDYEISKNNVKRSETNLGYATIYSPIDGVVLSRSVEEGQTVASSFSTPTLFTVAADLRDMRVIANVDEADIGNVMEGQKASFTVDAFPLDTFEGVITQVRQEAIIESNVVTYEVVISAANPDLKLKPGLTANIEIFVLDKMCDVAVAAAALNFNPPMPANAKREGAGEGRRQRISGAKVWVKSGERIMPKAVEVGVSNGITTEIISGVEPQDSIVTGVLITASSQGAMRQQSNSQSPFAPKRPGGGGR